MTERNLQHIPPEQQEQISSTLPRAGLVTPEDAVAAIVFLSSQANRQITGADRTA